MDERDDSVDFQKIESYIGSPAGFQELEEWSDEKRREIELGGRRDFFELRKKWSRYLFWFLTATLAFQFLVGTGVGFGFMSFPSDSVVYVIVGENFVQIIGLAVIVVKFLFSRGD